MAAAFTSTTTNNDDDDAANNPCHDSVLLRTITPSPRLLQYEDVHISNADLIRLVEQDTSLSDETRASYVCCLKRITDGGPGSNGATACYAPLIPHATLLWCIKNPEQACQLMRMALQNRGATSYASLKNYIGPLMSCLARHPVLSKKTELRQRWKQALLDFSVKPTKEQLKNNKPTARQLNGFVPYPEIVAKFKELCDTQLGSSDTLLVGTIALAHEQWLPQRADYGAVRIFHHHPVGIEQAQGNNYLVLTGECCYIMLQQYKTAKAYGPKRIQLPAIYVKALRASLQQHPRDYLFTQKKDNHSSSNVPYDKGSSFSRMANRRFEALFGRPLTLSGARHSYVTWLHGSSAWANMSDAEREAVSHGMSHSMATAMQYRFAAKYVSTQEEEEEEVTVELLHDCRKDKKKKKQEEEEEEDPSQ